MSPQAVIKTTARPARLPKPHCNILSLEQDPNIRTWGPMTRMNRASARNNVCRYTEYPEDVSQQRIEAESRIPRLCRTIPRQFLQSMYP